MSNAGPEAGDIFGKQLWANYNGYPHETLERSDGHLETWSASYYFSNENDWPERVRHGLAVAAGKVLDIGCGAGRHALHLQDNGHDVVALDSSPGAVPLSRERGVYNAQVGDIQRLNESSPEISGIDSFLLMGANIGLLQSPEAAHDILARLHDISTGTARIIGEGVDPYTAKDPGLVDYFMQNERKGRPYGARHLRTVFDGQAGEWFDYLALPVEELEAIGLEAGWKMTQVINDGGRYVVVMQED